MVHVPGTKNHWNPNKCSYKLSNGKSLRSSPCSSSTSRSSSITQHGVGPGQKAEITLKAASNRCIASNNKCLTSSNKKLVETSALLLVTIRLSSWGCTPQPLNFDHSVDGFTYRTGLSTFQNRCARKQTHKHCSLSSVQGVSFSLTSER